MKIILKNITLLHPGEKIDSPDTDLVIENGIIKKIGTAGDKDQKDAKVIDFNSKYVVPGLFDMHVHLREPGREDEETVQTGCNSAAAGGFTGIACMPNTEPAIDTAEVVNLIRSKAADHLVDVYPVGAATMSRKGEVISPMAELKEAGASRFFG